MGRGCKTERCDVHKGCWLAINKENHFSSAWPSFSLASPEADLEPTLTRRGTPVVDVAPLTGGEKPPALLSTTKIMLPFWAFMFVCTIFCFRNHLSFLTSARHELTGGEVTAKNLKKSKSWKHGIWFNFRFAKKRNTFWFPRNFFLLSKKRGTYFYSHFLSHCQDRAWTFTPNLKLFVLECSAIIEVGHVKLLACLRTRSNGDHYSIRFNQRTAHTREVNENRS